MQLSEDPQTSSSADACMSLFCSSDLLSEMLVGLTVAGLLINLAHIIFILYVFYYRRFLRLRRLIKELGVNTRPAPHLFVTAVIANPHSDDFKLKWSLQMRPALSERELGRLRDCLRSSTLYISMRTLYHLVHFIVILNFSLLWVAMLIYGVNSLNFDSRVIASVSILYIVLPLAFTLIAVPLNIHSFHQCYEIMFDGNVAWHRRVRVIMDPDTHNQNSSNHHSLHSTFWKPFQYPVQIQFYGEDLNDNNPPPSSPTAEDNNSATDELPMYTVIHDETALPNVASITSTTTSVMSLHTSSDFQLLPSPSHELPPQDLGELSPPYEESPPGTPALSTVATLPPPYSESS